MSTAPLSDLFDLQVSYHALAPLSRPFRRKPEKQPVFPGKFPSRAVLRKAGEKTLKKIEKTVDSRAGIMVIYVLR